MNVRTLIPALLCGLLLIACSDKKKAVVKDTTYTSFPGTTSSEPPTKKPETDNAPQFGGSAPGDSLFFSLRKTPCFGKCKAYEINVYRSGYATFNGHSNVELEGMFHGRVGMDTLNTLLTQAEKIDFFNLQDKYDNENVTDLPSSIIRVVSKGKDKRVIGRMGTPEAFKGFVTMAEELLYPMVWKPIPKEE